MNTTPGLEAWAERLTDESFVALLSAFANTEDRVRLTAEGLKVSIPTVRRWKKGRNLPHRNLRGAVIRYIDKEMANGN